MRARTKREAAKLALAALRAKAEKPRVEPTVAAPSRREFLGARPDRLAGRFSVFAAASPREEVRRDLRGLVAHARFAAQNVDYIRGFEKLVRRHVVGPQGIRLQMQAKDPNGRLDEGANAEIESAWLRWGKRGTCTVCGRLSWWNVENIAATMLAREGNLLLRVVEGVEAGPFRFRVEVLSLDLLDLDMVETLGGGAWVEGGVEFDAEGRVRAYHLWSAHPGDRVARRSLRRVRVPAESIIHVFRPVEAMQALGVPESHTALRRFNMIGAYEEAALAAAHYGAANMLLLETEDDAGGAATAPGGFDRDPPIDEIAAGTTATLPPGTKVANWSPNYPDGEMPPFVKHMIRGGATGLGVSYASLSSDLEGANFSSLRAGLGEERDEWRMWQRDLFTGLHAEVFARWLPNAITAGEVRLPFSKLDKFNAATWRPRGWRSVNPKDDATANESDLANNLRAPSDIAGERGEDFAEVVGRIVADRALLAKAGLSLAPSQSPRAPDPAAE